jgi:hypothetical protein
MGTLAGGHFTVLLGILLPALLGKTLGCANIDELLDL